MENPKFASRGLAGAWVLLAVYVGLIAVNSPVRAQSESTVYTFTNSPDGARPAAGLIMEQGKFYGTTVAGGTGNGGTVFKFNTSGEESVLYSFQPHPPPSAAIPPEQRGWVTDGANPYGGVVMDGQGNLYGTTAYGGLYSESCHGCGTVFEVSATDEEKLLYTFAGSPDGANPQGTLAMDAQGNVYGTTVNGGAHGKGTVFKLSPAGVETVLYSFEDAPDGANPGAGVIMDGEGNLYGTTTYGGSQNTGIVFEVTLVGAETVLYRFCQQGGCADGGLPAGRLIMDAQGNLYGTASAFGEYGWGAVFKVTPGGEESVLYSFKDVPGDGAYPDGGVVMDARGNLYGTTTYGGANFFYGTVFELSPDNTETVLYSFCATNGCPDGSIPQALVLDAQGDLYGTTYEGGSANCYLGCGVVFKMTP